MIEKLQPCGDRQNVCVTSRSCANYIFLLYWSFFRSLQQQSKTTLGDARNIKRVFQYILTRPTAAEVIKQLAEFEVAHAGAISSLTVPQLRAILQVPFCDA